MREFKYVFLPVAGLLLVCVASSLWTVDARKNGNPTKPNKAKARASIPRQKAEPDAAQARADLKRLERQREAEAWEYAVRAYPNGIPEGARARALEAINEMKVRAAATLSGAKPLRQARAEAATIEGTSWFPIGPAPITGFFSGNRVSGRASAVAANPANPDEIWLGTSSGGVWHSTNGGVNWAPISDNVASLAIGALALDGCTSSGCVTIYAGTGENAIRRDTLYGAGLLIGENSGGEINIFTWTLQRGATSANPNANLFSRGSINNVVLDPTTSGGTKRIYVTLSSGETASATESTVTAPPPPQGYGIFKSDNKGATWVKLNVEGTDGAKPTDLEMDPQDNNTLYAGFMGKGVFKTTNGGANWCPLNPGITVAGCTAATFTPVAPTNFDHVELAITRPSAANPAILYAMFGDCPNPTSSSCKPSIYKSTDGGNSWTRTLAGDPTEVLSTSCPYVYSRYTHALTIDPTNSNVLLLGGVSLCRSMDSGANFAVIGTNIHLDHHAVVFHPTNPMRVYDASDGGFAFSADGGSSWSHRNDDLQITGFQSIASSPGTQRVIAGSQDNGVVMWTGTRDWMSVAGGDGGATLIDLDTTTKMYSTIWSGASQPVRSTNSGTSGYSFVSSGIPSSDPRAFYPPFVQDPSGAHPLYFGTNRLFKSANDGDLWTPVSPVLGGTAFFDDIRTTNVITAIAVAPSNANRIYIGYYDGQIWVSKASGPCDSMACWDKVSDGKGLPQAVVTRIAVPPTSPDTAYATFSGFGAAAHVFKTTNGGSAWSSASGAGAGALPDIPANTITIEPSAPARLWLGTDLGIFKSLDGGASWTPFGMGLPNAPVYEISIDEVRGRVWAATHGRGAFILTQPFLSNFEGWVDNGIWDIPVYGHGFVPGSTPCTVRVIQQNGNTCAMGSTDVMGGAISVDASGQLVTSKGGFYMGKPVAWACFNGKCLGNTPISACNQTGNRIAAVTASCDVPFGGGTSVGLDVLLGCPQLNNPPSSVLGLTGNPGALVALSQSAETKSALAAGAFDLVPTVQSGDGTTRALCTVRVPFQTGDEPEEILERARDAVNASPSCVANTVSAYVSPGREEAQVEDEFGTEPGLALTAPGVNGGELFTSLHAAPGNATGMCFNVGGIGVPVVNSLIISKLKFETQAGGAAGGTVTVTERSSLGVCQVTVPTAAGATAANVATAVANAFLAPGIPGPQPGCPSRNNPQDVTVDGDSLITVLPSGLEVCIRDAGLGVFVGPEEIINQVADVSITKTVAPSTVVTGSNLTYTMKVTNNGPDAATNVVVNDNLPSSTTFVSCAATGGGVCDGSGNARTITFASLASGASATITLVATANCSVADGAVISNTATINPSGFDSNAANNSATATATASNPPPVIVCPANVTAKTLMPGDASATVNYPNPTVTDNCPGVTIVCSPPSGSIFPAGTTTVTCTATDAGGAKASCSFTVMVFDVCLQDDKSGDVLYFNSFTGDYQFTRCGPGGFTIAGRAMVNRTLCLTTITDARVSATLDHCLIAPQNRGSATIKPNPIGEWFYIKDSNTANNTCGCT